WVAMALAYLIAYFGARVRLGGVLRGALSPTGDLHRDIALLSNLNAQKALEEQADPWERRGLALPMIAFSLLAPLAIHFLVFALLCLGSRFTTRERQLLDSR